VLDARYSIFKTATETDNYGFLDINFHREDLQIIASRCDNSCNLPGEL